MKIDLPNDYNLVSAERLLCELALARAGSIVEAAPLLGVTRHGLKRRIIKHGIRWPQYRPTLASVVSGDGVVGE